MTTRVIAGSKRELVWVFEADSWFEAMSMFHERMGWGEYTTDHPDIAKLTYMNLGWECPFAAVPKPKQVQHYRGSTTGIACTSL